MIHVGPERLKGDDTLEDNQILELYWSRSERAISETLSKYGNYCRQIAFGILSSTEDAEEVVNDTCLGAWNSIPPHRPAVLSAFLAKITRRISIDRWRASTAAQRGNGELPVALEELAECVPAGNSVEAEAEVKELQRLIGAFIRSLPDTERRVFLCRYWYLDAVPSISRQFGFTDSKVKSLLFRTRQKLRTYLEKEGVTIDCR